jgi:hypothetical protein
MANLATISDRVALVAGGRVVDLGEPSRVINSYRNQRWAA